MRPAGKLPALRPPVAPAAAEPADAGSDPIADFLIRLEERFEKYAAMLCSELECKSQNAS